MAETLLPETPVGGSPPLAFTADDIARAHTAYGLNCGPCALAAYLGLSLDAIRPHLATFAAKGHMNSADMVAAARSAGFDMISHGTGTLPGHGLVRVQFGGPWSPEPGVTSRWAATHTHWIATQVIGEGRDTEIWFFDINGLWRPRVSWEAEVLPELVKAKPRRDGRWWPTNCWEVRERAQPKSGATP